MTVSVCIVYVYGMVTNALVRVSTRPAAAGGGTAIHQGRPPWDFLGNQRNRAGLGRHIV